MSNERDTEWAAFEAAGIDEVRRRLGARQYGDRKESLAREWLAHHESKQRDAHDAAILEEARAANAFAKEANATAHEANSIASIAAESAARGVASARRSNVIAVAALVVAAIAVLISFFERNHAP